MRVLVPYPFRPDQLKIASAGPVFLFFFHQSSLYPIKIIIYNMYTHTHTHIGTYQWRCSTEGLTFHWIKMATYVSCE